MNKLFISIAFIITTMFSAVSNADQYVNGYYKSNGTFVQGHYRSSPNNTVRDNYSYKSNTNPYTGQTGTQKYRNNSTSEYYQGNSRKNSSRNKGNSYKSPSNTNSYQGSRPLLQPYLLQP